MSVFADSSALVKLYADEPGAAEVRAVEVLATSWLARVEVPAALWRKVRTGELSPEQTGILVGDFEADWYGEQGGEARLLPVVARPALLEAAARAVAVHGLRAYDGVQLASAVAVRAAAGTHVFACFDAGLRRAAAAEGFALLPGS